MARIQISGSNTWVKARFLDGGEPDWRRAVTPRQALSEWIARGDNPWLPGPPSIACGITSSASA